jgi:hypothetical protein
MCDAVFPPQCVFMAWYFVKHRENFTTNESQGNSVGIAIGYGLDDRGPEVPFPVGAENFFPFSLRPDRLWVPPSLLFNGYRRALSSGVKRLARGANHSPVSSAVVKNAWSCTSTPQYVFMAWCLVKHRENFTFITKNQKTSN